MAHSRIPKFTKSRPFGMPQTPFNPMTGKHASFVKNPEIVNVVVDHRIADSDAIYVCKVLDENLNKSGATLKVHALDYDGTGYDDIAEDTAAFAFKIKDKWYMRVPEEVQLETIDFAVDLFDRADDNDLNGYWGPSTDYTLSDGEAIVGASGRNYDGYQFNLTQNNRYYKFSYRYNNYANLEWYVDYLLTHPTSTTSPEFTLFQIYLAGPDPYYGLEIHGKIEIARAIANDPLYANYTSSFYASPIYENLSTDSEIITDISQVDYSGSILFEINETTVSCTGTHFNGSYDMQTYYAPGMGFTRFSESGLDTDHAIDNWKVWRSDIPEPPSGESGHGRYIDGEFVYLDIYHSLGGYNPTLEPF